jgi:hypothetical protein
MILTSTTETVLFTPPWLEGAPNAPVFQLRAGSVIERGQMEAELAGTHRAGKVFGYELRQAIRSGVLALLSDDPDLDRVLGIVEAESEGDADTLSEDDRKVLGEVRKVLAEHWSEYRDLVAQLERRREIAPIVALRRFCVSIDAPSLTFARGRDGLVSEATLAALDPLEMLVAGNHAYALQWPGVTEGNSPRPSPSDASPKPSSSAATSKADGRSRGSGGPKTRAPRSRLGSGTSSTSGS